MDKTRVSSSAVSFAAFAVAAGLQLSGYTNPLLAGWLCATAVGALVIATKPNWAAIHVAGRRKSEAQTVTAEPALPAAPEPSLSDAARQVLAQPVLPEVEPIRWEDDPIIAIDRPEPHYLTTHIVGARGRNASDKEVQLDQAYLVSGVTGERREMTVMAGPPMGRFQLPLDEAGPIPPGAYIQLHAEFTTTTQPRGMPEAEFMEKWGRFSFVAAYAGIEHRQTFEPSVAARLFGQMRPTPNPQVTRRKDAK